VGVNSEVSVKSEAVRVNREEMSVNREK